MVTSACVCIDRKKNGVAARLLPLRHGVAGRRSYIVHVAKINLRCKYMSFIMVKRVPFAKMNTLFQQNTKFSIKTLK